MDEIERTNEQLFPPVNQEAAGTTGHYLVLWDDVAGEVQQTAELQAVGDNTKQDFSRRVLVETIASGELCYLDLLPSLANLDEEAPRRRHVRQGSLCVAVRVLHHDVARCKSLQLDEAREENETQTHQSSTR